MIKISENTIIDIYIPNFKGCDSSMIAVLTSKNELIFVEIIENKTKLTFTIKSFFCYNICQKLSVSMQFAFKMHKLIFLIQNNDGFQILKIGKYAKCIHEITFQREGLNLSMCSYFDLIEENSDNFELYVYYFSHMILEHYICKYEKKIGITSFKLKKNVKIEVELVLIGTLGENHLLGITLSKSLIRIQKQTFDMIQILTKDINFSHFQKSSKNELIAKSEKIDDNHNLTSFLIVFEPFSWKEQITNCLNLGLFTFAMNMFLNVQNNENINSNEDELKAISRTIARSYFNFISHLDIKNDYIAYSIQILIEFLILSRNQDLLSDFTFELIQKKQKPIINFIAQAFVDYSISNNYFNITKICDELIILIFDILFEKNDKNTIYCILCENSFKDFKLIHEITPMLKSFELAYPILKLIIDDSLLNQDLLVCLFSIFIHTNQLSDFSQFLLQSIQNSQISDISLNNLKNEHIELFRDFFMLPFALNVYMREPIVFVDVYSNNFILISSQNSNSIKNKSMGSILYNFFINQSILDFPFDFICHAISHAETTESDRVDFCFSLLIMNLIVQNCCQFNYFVITLTNLMFDVILKNYLKFDDKKCFKLFVKFFKKYRVFCFEFGLDFQSNLSRFHEFSEKTNNDYLKFYFFDFTKNWEKSINLWIFTPTIHFELDIFRWIQKKLDNFIINNESNRLIDIFCEHLSIFVKVNKNLTNDVLYSIQDFSLKHVHYLKDFPDLIISKLQSELATGKTISKDLQILFIRSVLKINEDFLISALKNYKLDLELTLQEVGPESEVRGIIFAKFGNSEGLKNIVLAKIQQIYDFENKSEFNSNLCQNLYISVLFLLEEFNNMGGKKAEEVFYFYKEVFTKIHLTTKTSKNEQFMILKEIASFMFKKVLNQSEVFFEHFKDLDIDNNEMTVALNRFAKNRVQIEKIKTGFVILDSMEERTKLLIKARKGLSSLYLRSKNMCDVKNTYSHEYMKYFIILEERFYTNKRVFWKIT